MSEGYFPHNGTNLFYTVQGPENGIPILLIHGWTCDQADWVFQIPFLLMLLLQSSQRFRIIAFDLRGHGRSTVHTNITLFDPITLTYDTAALAGHLNISAQNKAIVFGHSLGGILATELAARRPDLVQGLVLIDPAYYMTPSAFADVIEQFQHSPDAAPQITTTFLESAYSSDTPDWIKMWHQLRAWGVDPRVIIESFDQLAGFLGPSGAEYLRTVKHEAKAVPRLVVGANPGLLDIEREAGLNETLDQVELLPAGHWLHKVDPDGFNAILQQWMTRWGYFGNVTSQL